jgi:Protein of unknown function (DUF742)
MDAEDGRWTEWESGPVSRPYMVTGGRTRPRGDRFYALLDVVGRGRAAPDQVSLGPEQIRILDLCRVPLTVADLASDVDLPLGVVRILLDDLVQESLIEVRTRAPSTPITDKQLLRQVLDGLHTLLLSAVGAAYHVPPGAWTPRIRPPVGGILDSRSDALVGHRLVIEARDDMQVGVEAALIVPAERVAVGSEPLVQFGSDEKQKFPCRRPLLGGQVERGSPVDFRDDDAAAWNHVGRVTRVSG